MKKYLLAGLLVWLPIAITVWLISSFLGGINHIFTSCILWIHNLLQISVSPFMLKLTHIPGIGLVFIFILIFVTGMFALNIAGRYFLTQWNKLMGQIPIVKSIYSTTKQISDTLLSDNGQSFKEAVLIQYPHQGIWTIAFVTGAATHIMPSAEYNYISVFVPTTPNPTSGFLLILPETDVKKMHISVEQALKYVISMGVLNIDANIDTNIGSSIKNKKQ
jgi:uncharacterized membrane protein